MKLGQKTLFIVLLFAGLVLLNYLASQISGARRCDRDHIYTLSGGTKALLAKVDEPITIDFYFSESASGLRIEVKTTPTACAKCSASMCAPRTGRSRSTSSIRRPNHPQEEKATAGRIEAQRARRGPSRFTWAWSPRRPISRRQFRRSPRSGAVPGV